VGAAVSVFQYGQIVFITVKYFTLNKHMKKYIVPDEIKDLPELDKICKAIDKIADSEILERLKGNCISGSDMLQNLLHYYGIESKIVECQIFVSRENSKIPFLFVGFNNLTTPSPNLVDTHVVVVTETSTPVLIDASLAHILPRQNQIVVKGLNCTDDEKFCEFKHEDTTVTYFHKKNLKLPSIHQKNLLQRIKSEEETNKRLTFLQKAVIGLGLFSLTNFILNVTMIAIKLMLG